jgi:hypothetical protein
LVARTRKSPLAAEIIGLLFPLSARVSFLVLKSVHERPRLEQRYVDHPAFVTGAKLSTKYVPMRFFACYFRSAGSRKICRLCSSHHGLTVRVQACIGWRAVKTLPCTNRLTAIACWVVDQTIKKLLSLQPGAINRIRLGQSCSQ